LDALLGDKETAIAEAKRAADMLPISKDLVKEPFIAANLAAVHVWANEFDVAFERSIFVAKNSTFPAGLRLVKDGSHL
jgi:hypothetical protein